MDSWLNALESPGTSVRVIFLDYTKAFDRKNHNILMQKIESLEPHPCIVRWIAAFLQGRNQQVKIGNTTSGILPINGAVPQGALLGMEAFEIMISDLKSIVDIKKYVDDTTLSEILRELQPSRLQDALNDAVEWTRSNDMNINRSKTNVMNITFSKKVDFTPLSIASEPIETVSSAKLVGVYLQSDLKWNAHIDSIVKKAAPRLYYLRQLKRSKATVDDMLKFYLSIVRPVLEYAAPVWSSSLPEYLVYRIEQVQKRALRIILPHLDYTEALKFLKLTPPLYERVKAYVKNFFRKIENSNDKINHILPPKRSHNYHTRNPKKYCDMKIRTERYKKSFIPYSIDNFK